MEQERVLAMYDVRGIQDYIFRTAKVKDAIGASGLVEDIISDAMKAAVAELEEDVDCELEWYNENGGCAYDAENQKDVQVLYIGGGNAYFTFRDRELCIEVNRYMSKYVIDHTYSLQLAIGIVPYTGNYQEDCQNIFQEMNQVKGRMIVSRPLGALPIMKRDAKTGYTFLYEKKEGREIEVKEARQKKLKEQTIRRLMDHKEKIFDNYITEKGLDSTLAIVHIDGNNMGLRIRSQVEKIQDYGEAVMTMRRISYRINHAYKKVFYQMKKHFDQKGMEETGRPNSVLKVLVAGDDITYVCNGRIGIDTVEYFAKEIVSYTMDGKKEDTCKSDGYGYPLEKETDKGKIAGMGFSVCAGIAFINSHFPFYAGYEVAEACCESAKARAKRDCYKSYSTADCSGKPDRIANWVDFQICKNIQAQNLSVMRKKEYQTSHGEDLLIRPYFIQTEGDFGMDGQVEPERTLADFKQAVRYFQNSSNMPRSFAKKLRNTYSQGEFQMGLFCNFLESRGWKFPDGKNSPYFEQEGKRAARWYDALEMSDYYFISDKGEQIEEGKEYE